MESKDRPLKIAMVVASPFPANHGTPGSIKEMAEAIAAKKHQVHIVTYHFGEGDLPKGVRIHRITDMGFGRKVVVGPTWKKPILDLLMVFTLIRVIMREKIDLIHAHNYEGALIGYLARIVTRRPMIYNAINTMSDELPTYTFFRTKKFAIWLARVLDYWVPRTANKVICISDDLAHFLHTQGIRPERIHVIPLGVDDAPFKFNEDNRSVIRERYHIGESPLVMYTGTLDRFQRIDYLLKAMKMVVEKIGNARLLIVANIAKEQDLDVCRASIREIDLQGHVETIINRSFEEIPPLLAAADVTVISRPNCPGFPVKLLNYMASGKPIVVFEGSAKGLQHMKHAIVVKDHDWQAIGQGVITLLQDPVLSEVLGQNARQWLSENLSWPNIVGKIENAYYSLIG